MDEGTRREIDKAAWNILREARIVEPPVRIDAVLRHLHLHRDFYDLEDPALLRRFWHKVKVKGHRLSSIIQKIKLAGVWLPSEMRILIDVSLPSPKQEWASFHDSMHRILTWHRPFFLGDTAQTLDPDYQLMLENEANYGASALMFCGPVFTSEARDANKDWTGVMALKRRYGKSWMTTLRRYVEHGPDHPMAMMVSTPYWKIKPADRVYRWRYFVRSKRFASHFAKVDADQLLAAVDANSLKRRGGPIADFALMLPDDNGTHCEFRGESFNNTYDILTLFVQVGGYTAKSIIIPTFGGLSTKRKGK
jgi:hypothetical protein